MEEKEKLISQKELVEISRMSRCALYRHIKKGILTPIKIGSSNYFTEKEVLKFLDIEK